MQNRQNEPLGHELFREAWGQRKENPRSALVIGIAAAEIGIKQCVSALVPSSQWLVENLPSPPIEKILAEYFPTLPVKNRINDKVVIPKSIVEKLRKGIQMRNSIIHGKSTSLSFENVTEILTAVENLLHLLDYYCGHTWALKNITTDEQETLLQELR